MRASSSMHCLIIILCLSLLLLAFQVSFAGGHQREFKTEKFVNLTKSSFSQERNDYALATLKKAAGVYLDKSSAKESGLDKTVVSIVLGYNNDGIFHYKVYFLNFLCFIRHYKIDLVVYILHHNIKNLEEEIIHLESLGVRVITYPDYLFWELISHKKTFKVGKSEAQYTGDIPSFQSYGALPMLVPAYEMISMGFDVIYFDVDIALVQNPIPFLTKGNVDFTSSLEIRGCTDMYTSSYPNDYYITGWRLIEPNTGIMHVRSTEQGKSFYRTWLNRIVESNSMNDQKLMDRIAIGSVYNPSCNIWNLTNVKSEPNPHNLPSYCFLTEILFQNGKVGVQCPSKPIYRDGFLQELWDWGHAWGGGDLMPGKRFPVTVHVNYVNGKTHELKARGLWLLNDDQVFHSHEVAKRNHTLDKIPEFLKCKNYNLTSTYYYSIGWEGEIKGINEYQKNILKSVLVNGTLIKSTSGEAVYLVDEAGHRRIVPNSDTFEALGLEWGDIKGIPQRVMNSIKEGIPLKKINNLLFRRKYMQRQQTTRAYKA